MPTEEASASRSLEMPPQREGNRAVPGTGWRILLWVVVAATAFHAAYAAPAASWLMVVYLFALLQLAQAAKWRAAFYPGLAVGLLIAAGRLDFFWNIFSYPESDSLTVKIFPPEIS